MHSVMTDLFLYKNTRLPTNILTELKRHFFGSVCVCVGGGKANQLQVGSCNRLGANRLEVQVYWSKSSKEILYVFGKACITTQLTETGTANRNNNIQQKL